MVFRTERDRQAYEAWAAQDRLEQAAIAERLERPIREAQLKRELEKNAGRLVAHQRRQTLYGYVEHPYVSPEVAAMTFNSEEELDTFMRLESRKFVEETPEWKRFNNPANIDVLLSYFSNRGIKVFDRKMLKSAFVSLRELLEPNQAPASVPMPVAPAPVDEDLENLPRIPLWETQPIAYKREIQQVYRGIDSETGLPRDFTQTQVDAMSAEIFKRTFEVPTTHLGRFTFGRK